MSWIVLASPICQLEHRIQRSTVDDEISMSGVRPQRDHPVLIPLDLKSKVSDFEGMKDTLANSGNATESLAIRAIERKQDGLSEACEERAFLGR